MYRFLPHPLITATFAVAFTYFFLYGQPVFDDSDMPWHIAAGDWILSHHSIPKYDPFSYTAGQTPWYNISWLWDVLLSIINTRYGLQGIHLFSVLIAALTLAIVHYSLQKRGVLEDPAMVAIFVSGIVLSSFSLARPQIVTYLLVAIFCLLLQESKKNKPWHLCFLPPLMVLWVNMHGGFLTGFILLGAYGFEAMLRKEWRWFRQLFGAGVLTLGAIFINPYGVGIITATLRTLDSVITPYISEWHPFTYGIVLPYTLYILVMFLVSNPRDKDVPLVDKLLTFSWLLMALSSERNFPILALVSAPYMAINMQKAMVLHSHPDLSAPRYRYRLACFAVAVMTMFCIPPIQHFVGKELQTSNRIPTEEIAFIKQHYPRTRFFNDYDIGGYLIYFMQDPSKIFVDGRAGTAYSEAHLSEVIKVFSLSPGFEAIFDKHKVDGIIVKNSHPLVKYYNVPSNTTWKKAFKGNVATVYIRNAR